MNRRPLPLRSSRSTAVSRSTRPKAPAGDSATRDNDSVLEPGDAHSLALALIGRVRRSGITELRTIGLIARFGNGECVFEVGLGRCIRT